MQLTGSKISPCLWFDSQAAEAAKLYTSIFPDSKVIQTTHFSEVGHEIHGRPKGSVMFVLFQIAGQTFGALNGGPLFKFNEAVSFQVNCETQEEIDYYWSKLSAGGEEGHCGWLKDQFGVSWQVVPTEMNAMYTDAEPEKSGRMMAAMLRMTKLDLAELRRARAG